MDLDEIKRGLRAEIKKRENEQYATFQCNVRQMCKDVLAKLEEQESEIAELKAQKAQAEDDCAYWKMCHGNAVNAMHETEEACMHLTLSERHSNHKRCLDKAAWCKLLYEEEKDEWQLKDVHHWFRMSLFDKWRKRWLELAEEPTWEKFLQLIHKEGK